MISFFRFIEKYVISLVPAPLTPHPSLNRKGCSRSHDYQGDLHKIRSLVTYHPKKHFSKRQMIKIYLDSLEIIMNEFQSYRSQFIRHKQTRYVLSMNRFQSYPDHKL